MATDFLDPTTQLALRMTFDTAALVLIWLVQLVIYPVFLELAAADFRRWHPVYTRRVTYVVLPVMFGQAILYAYLVFAAPGWEVVLNGLLVVAMWAVTFLTAVPLHAALDGPEEHLPLAKRLLAVNWWRTAGWTLIWLITVWPAIKVLW